MSVHPETTVDGMTFILCACRVCPPRDHSVTWPLYIIPVVSVHPETPVGDMTFTLYTCRVCPPRDPCGWPDLYTLYLSCLSTQRPLWVTWPFILYTCRVCPPRDPCGWPDLYTLYLSCLSTQKPLWVTWPLHFIPAVSVHPETPAGESCFADDSFRTCVSGGKCDNGTCKCDPKFSTLTADKTCGKEDARRLYIYIIIIIDRFYIALFSALEQTHCARMWFYMSE